MQTFQRFVRMVVKCVIMAIFNQQVYVCESNFFLLTVITICLIFWFIWVCMWRICMWLIFIGVPVCPSISGTFYDRKWDHSFNCFLKLYSAMEWSFRLTLIYIFYWFRCSHPLELLVAKSFLFLYHCCNL